MDTDQNAQSVQPVQEEVLLGRWREPERPHREFDFRTRTFIIIGGLILLIGLSGLGFWMKQFTFYTAAAVILVAIVSILVQSKHPDPQQEVILTSQRLVVGKQEHPLDTLGGFWMENDEGFLVINVEMKKRGLFPISFFFPEYDPAQARTTMTQILPEIAPREEKYGQGISRMFKL